MINYIFRHSLRILLLLVISIHYVVFSFIIGLPLFFLLSGHYLLMILGLLFAVWKGLMPFECPLSTIECILENHLQLRPCRKFVKAWISPENAKTNWINLIQNKPYIPIDKDKS